MAFLITVILPFWEQTLESLRIIHEASSDESIGFLIKYGTIESRVGRNEESMTTLQPIHQGS